MYVVMVLVLVIISQNIILAIIASAYERATERMAGNSTAFSQSFLTYAVRIGWYNCLWLYFNCACMFNRSKVLERCLASRQLTGPRNDDGRAFILTLLPEMQVGCEPSTPWAQLYTS